MAGKGESGTVRIKGENGTVRIKRENGTVRIKRENGFKKEAREKNRENLQNTTDRSIVLACLRREKD